MTRYIWRPRNDPNGKLVEVGSRFDREAQSGPQIIKDIEPYQAMGVDIATGKAPRITSRSTHREYLRRNDYIERGNEDLQRKGPSEMSNPSLDIKRAIDEVRSRR